MQISLCSSSDVPPILIYQPISSAKLFCLLDLLAELMQGPHRVGRRRKVETAVRRAACAAGWWGIPSCLAPDPPALITSCCPIWMLGKPGAFCAQYNLPSDRVLSFSSDRSSLCHGVLLYMIPLTFFHFSIVLATTFW